MTSAGARVKKSFFLLDAVPLPPPSDSLTLLVLRRRVTCGRPQRESLGVSARAQPAAERPRRMGARLGHAVAPRPRSPPARQRRRARGDGRPLGALARGRGAGRGALRRADCGPAAAGDEPQVERRRQVKARWRRRRILPRRACRQPVLQGQCAELMPQLGRIDAIAQQVHELEGAVGQLDAYSRRLEAKFDALAASSVEGFHIVPVFIGSRTTTTRNATSSGAVGATPRPAASRSSSASWQSSVIACSGTRQTSSLEQFDERARIGGRSRLG